MTYLPKRPVAGGCAAAVVGGGFVGGGFVAVSRWSAAPRQTARGSGE